MCFILRWKEFLSHSKTISWKHFTVTNQLISRKFWFFKNDLMMLLWSFTTLYVSIQWNCQFDDNSALVQTLLSRNICQNVKKLWGFLNFCNFWKYFVKPEHLFWFVLWRKKILIGCNIYNVYCRFVILTFFVTFNTDRMRHFSSFRISSLMSRCQRFHEKLSNSYLFSKENPIFNLANVVFRLLLLLNGIFSKSRDFNFSFAVSKSFSSLSWTCLASNPW